MRLRNEKRLDPRVHSEVIGLLVDRQTDGSLFDARNDPKRCFAGLLVARSCLNPINEAIDNESG